MLVHYAMYLISYCIEKIGKNIYLPFMITNLPEFIKYYKTAKECLTLCKTYNAYVDAKEVSKCEDIGNDFVDSLLHLARGLQFILVGEMTGRKVEVEGSRRNCAKFYIKSIEELYDAKNGFSNFKHYKSVCYFIDVLNPILTFHANLYLAFDNKLKYPLSDGEIEGFGKRGEEGIFDLLSSESSFNYLYKYSESSYVYYIYIYKVYLLIIILQQLKKSLKSDVVKEIGRLFPNYLTELETLLEEAKRQAEGQLSSWPVVEQPEKLEPAPMKADTPLILPTSTIVAGVFVFTENKPNQPPPSSPPTGGTGGIYQPQFVQPPPQYQTPQFVQPPPQQQVPPPQYQTPQFINPQQQVSPQQPQYYQPQFVQPPPMQQPPQQYPRGAYPPQQPTQYYQQPPAQQQSLPPPSQYTPYQPQYQYPPPPR